MVCKHLRGDGFKVTKCRRSIKRAGCPESQQQIDRKKWAGLFLCLGCGVFMSEQEIVKHTLHHVFVHLATLELMCKKCQEKQVDELLVTVHTSDTKVDEWVDELDDWILQHDLTPLMEQHPDLRANREQEEHEDTREQQEEESKDHDGGYIIREKPTKKKKKKKTKKNIEEEEEEEEGYIVDKMGDLKLVDEGHLNGIANVGNSCFLNSILQVLAHTPAVLEKISELCQQVDEDEELTDEIDIGFTRSLEELLLAVRTGDVASETMYRKARKGKKQTQHTHLKRKRVDPKQAFGYIMAKAPQLSGFGQQDAHELLLEVMRILEEEEKLVRGTSSKETSYINNLFSSQVLRRVQCKFCGHETRKEEENVVTSLEIKKDIPSCMDTIKTEIQLLVKEGNGLECDKCSKTTAVEEEDNENETTILSPEDDDDAISNDPVLDTTLVDSEGQQDDAEQGEIGDEGQEASSEEDDELDSSHSCEEEVVEPTKKDDGISRRDAVIKECLSKPPPIMILHLKRFNMTFENGHVHSKKISNSVSLQETETFSFADETTVAYRLFGIVCHHGKRMNRGHYICYVKPFVESTQTRSQNWWFASDSNVRKVETHSALTSQGYVLFYEQIDKESQK